MVFAEEIHAFAYMLLFLRAGVRRFYIRLKIEGELRASNLLRKDLSHDILTVHSGIPTRSPVRVF